MKKFKTIIALTAVLAMTCTTAVMAAPSPTAGVVTIAIPGKGVAEPAQLQPPTIEELTALANYISENAASLGIVPSVKTSVNIVAPAGYKGGDVPTVIAAAGLKDGAKNVFAYIRLKNGKIIIVPCTVKNGFVGFMAPAFGTVSIVELNYASYVAPVYTDPQIAPIPATLH